MSTPSVVQIIEGSEVTKIIQINKGKQICKVQLQTFLVNLHFQDEIVYAKLRLYYEFKDGWFRWDLYTLNEDEIKNIADTKYLTASGEVTINYLLEDAYFSVSNTKMVHFRLGAPTQIFVKEFVEYYATFEQARQMVLTYLEKLDLGKKVGGYWDNLEQGRFINSPKEIPIGREVDRRFFYRPTGRKGRNIFGEFVGAQITEVTYQDALWKIQLESTENRQTMLVLDEDFKLINVLGDGAKE